MSSFIGHGLAALTIGKLFDTTIPFKRRYLWLGFLVLCAFAPDIDYLIEKLNLKQNSELRITHSIGFCLILPALAMTFFAFKNRKFVFWAGLQALLAGVSHLILDLFVGGRVPDPLFFPISNKQIGPLSGILPSAGQLSVTNYYLYRNSVIEVGVLVPIFLLILVSLEKIKLNKPTVVSLWLCLTFFLFWSLKLSR